MADRESGQESKHKTRMVGDTLNNHETKLYFLFLYPIVTECKRVNVAFQADHCRPEKLFLLIRDFLHKLQQSNFTMEAEICYRVSR